jgi:hypothetical protein
MVVKSSGAAVDPEKLDPDCMKFKPGVPAFVNLIAPADPDVVFDPMSTACPAGALTTSCPPISALPFTSNAVCGTLQLIPMLELTSSVLFTVVAVGTLPSANPAVPVPT